MITKLSTQDILPSVSVLNNQHLVQINASKVVQWSWLWWRLKIWPLVLKAYSEATVDTWIAKISFAIAWSVGYLRPFDLHHHKTLKLVDLGKTSSSK